MKILYLSCHEILEYDELRLLHGLGHECYSMGAYTNPEGLAHRKRPPLPQLPYDPHHIELELQHSKEGLIWEQLEGFDVAIIMHKPAFIDRNFDLWEKFHHSGRSLIWRSIGQSAPWVEHRIDNWKTFMPKMKIVRYSPQEQTIEGFQYEDALVRFYKDASDFPKWDGDADVVVNFTQDMVKRGDHVGLEWWRKSTGGIPAVVYGPGNKDLMGQDGGMLTYEEQLYVLRRARCYWYHGTYPASYTLSLIEAMFAGTPIVAVGAGQGNGEMYPDQDTYEADYILQDIAPLCSSPEEMNTECRRRIREKFSDQSLAQIERAEQLFGLQVARTAWTEVLSQCQR